MVYPGLGSAFFIFDFFYQISDSNKKGVYRCLDTSRNLCFLGTKLLVDEGEAKLVKNTSFALLYATFNLIRFHRINKLFSGFGF